jgi:RNA polymerase sigma-70 factor, ECF subfamily
VHVPDRGPYSDDLELLRAVAKGDPVAQHQLVVRLSVRIRRLTKLLSRNGTDADDISQRAIWEIIRSAGTFRKEARVEPWADRIVARVTLRHGQRESRRRLLTKRWFIIGALPFGRSKPYELNVSEGLDLFLNRLSPDRREALVLRHVLDYTVEEIAELTGAPVSTVKDRLVYARKQMRQWLEKHPGWSPDRGEQQVEPEGLP